MRLFPVAPEQLRFLSILCRFLTGHEQATTPTFTQATQAAGRYPDCNEGELRAIRTAHARSNRVKRSL